MSLRASSTFAASTSAPGTVELATDAEAKAVTSQALAVTPGNLAAVFAEPPALGSTTAAAVNATVVKAANGSVAAPSFAFSAAADLGIYHSGSNVLRFQSPSGGYFNFQNGASGGAIGVLDTTGFKTNNLVLNIASGDVKLERDAANTLALRNSTSTQIWRVYGTYTDASNYERVGLTTQAGTTTLYQEQAGTGTARNFAIGTAGAAILRFVTNNTTRWEVGATGHFTTLTDNTYDIGASGATRPRDYYGAGKITSAGATAGIGYATGAGGTVTQTTDKSTGVTLNKVAGQITMHNATLNAGDEVGFTVTNSAVAATDVIIVNVASGATANSYLVGVDAVASGSFHIVVSNVSASNLGEAIVLNFAVIKGVTA
jgi:hypothetical protein